MEFTPYRAGSMYDSGSASQLRIGVGSISRLALKSSVDKALVPCEPHVRPATGAWNQVNFTNRVAWHLD